MARRRSGFISRREVGGGDGRFERAVTRALPQIPAGHTVHMGFLDGRPDATAPLFGWSGRPRDPRVLDHGPLVTGPGVGDVLPARRVTPLAELSHIAVQSEVGTMLPLHHSQAWYAQPICIMVPPLWPWGRYEPRSPSITGMAARMLLLLCDARPAPAIVVRTHDLGELILGTPLTVVRIAPGVAALVLDAGEGEDPRMIHLSTIRSVHMTGPSSETRKRRRRHLPGR